MTQSSIFWDTSGAVGDGASAYTQAQLVAWLRRTFLNDNTVEGVLAGYANELEVTGSSSPVAVNTGAAVVYGFPYENDASVNVTVATPTVGTTGHRVVLRVNWSAQTVRIALLSSADGTASIPAVTQSANTTWEISLATLTITTGGVITVTDDRSYCHFNTLPLVYRRQGGSATIWSTPGTTDYDPGAGTRIEVGAVTLEFSNAASASAAVTLPVAFSYAPLVFVSWATTSYDNVIVVATAPTGATINVLAKTVDGTFITENTTAYWMAVGPE